MQEIEKLKEMMAVNNWSMETAAKKIGVSYWTLYRWFRKICKPSQLALDSIKKLIKKGESDES